MSDTPHHARRRLLAVLAAICVVVGLAGVPSAAEAAARARTLSLSVGPSPVVSGASVTASGTLSRSPRGTTVSIQRYTDRTWRTVKSTRTTTTTGRYAVTLAATSYGSASFRAVARKTSKLKAATSKTRTIVIDRTTTTTLSADVTELSAGESVRFSGRAAPFRSGTTVTLQRKVGTAWRADGATSTVGANGSYSFARTPQTGVWSYRAVVARSPSYTASATSAEVSVDVAGPASLQVQVLNARSAPNVTITDPAGRTRTISATTTIAPAVTGTWKVSGAPIDVAGGQAWPIAKDLEVVVVREQSAVVVMDYSAVVPDDTDVVDPAQVTTVASNGSQSTVGIAPGADVPDVGQTLVVGVGPETPYGLLGKVTAVDGRAATVQTGGASLLDAVSTGAMDVSVPLGDGDVVDAGRGDDVEPVVVQAQEGLVSSPSRRMARAAQTSPESLDRRVRKAFSCETGASAEISSEIGFRPSVNLTADWNVVDGIRSAEFTSSITQSASVSASLDAKGSCTLKRTALLKEPIEFRTISFSIGPVPVVLFPKLQLYVDGEAGFHASVSTSLKQTAQVTGGVRYADGRFSPIQRFTKTTRFDPPTFAGRVDAEAGIAPELSVLLYNVAGPRVYLRAALMADAHAKAPSPTPTLAWNLDLGLKAAAALDADVFELHSGELKLFETTFDLADGEVAYTPPPATTITTSTLPDATVDQSYSARLTTADNRPGAWSISAGSLPAGLKLDGDTITGSPSEPGTSGLTVRFDDGDTAITRSLSITVKPATGGGPGGTLTTTRVSKATDGSPADGHSTRTTISEDGRYIAFESSASNLVAGDTNRTSDVFVTDRITGVTTRVSQATDGTQSNGVSYLPAISADGRYITYTSYAKNLAGRDVNDNPDVFVTDRTTGVTSRVSQATDGTQADGFSFQSAISSDGRYVTFTSFAGNLVANDTNRAADVFVFDRTTGATSRVSRAVDGTQTDARSDASAISASGRYITYQSSASNVVAGDTNGAADVFLTDRTTGTTTQISKATDGTQANADSGGSAMSADGRYVAFDSSASNLVAGDTNDADDVFVTDRTTGVTTRVSRSTDGAQADGHSYRPAMSADGRLIAFTSSASTLVAGDTTGDNDVFVTERTTGATTWISRSPGDTQVAGYSYGAAIGAGGRYITFVSSVSNLVAGDTPNTDDVFLTEWR